MTLLGHSPKMLLEENRSRDQGDIVADPGLTGTHTYQAVESQVLLEVARCPLPLSSEQPHIATGALSAVPTFEVAP